MYRCGKEEIEEIAKVVESGQLFRVGDANAGHLKEVERFEEELAEKMGFKYALLISGGGTSALVCALAGLGIGPGDEVIVPAYTWMATATSVLTVGAIPVLADIDETMCLDPADLENKIGPNTKAVMPVHMVGRPADMDGILKVAKKHGLKVVEDTCQAPGGSYKGKRLGSIGDAGALSFNSYKAISCGEGGGLVTSEREVYEKAFVYHDSGAAFRPKAGELQIPIFVAQQYRAHEIMGAMMRVQLGRLDGILADLRNISRGFESELGDVLKVAPNNDIEGDCGIAATFTFGDEASARDFANKAKVNGPNVWLPIDSGKHVYTNWEPLIEKRIMHHPDMNPFNFPKNQGLRMDYTDEMCERTLGILRRTVYISINPDWTEEQVSKYIEQCRSAAG